MINAKPTVSKSLNVAESVEDGERVSVFQYADAVVHARRGREDIKILTDGNDFFYYVRNRSAVVRDHRCSARHRFDHDEPEWLRPVDGKKQCVGISQELVLFFVADFPDTLRYGRIA